MREKLTNEEWNAVSHLTRETHLDEVFDIANVEIDENDKFIDFENNNNLSLKDGLALLYDGMAYPATHDGLTIEEADLITSLLLEFDIIDEDESKRMHDECVLELNK